MYGHVEKLAEEIKKGAASVEGVEAKLWQVCASYYWLFQIWLHIEINQDKQNLGCMFGFPSFEVVLIHILADIWASGYYFWLRLPFEEHFD